MLLGGGALVAGGAAQGSPSSTCGAQASSVATGVASRRAELQQVLTPAGSALVTTGSHGLAALRQSLDAALGCRIQIEKVAPAPVVSGDVPQAPWRIREMAGGPPHCAVV